MYAYNYTYRIILSNDLNLCLGVGVVVVCAVSNAQIDAVCESVCLRVCVCVYVM